MPLKLSPKLAWVSSVVYPNDECGEAAPLVHPSHRGFLGEGGRSEKEPRPMLMDGVWWLPNDRDGI